MQADAAGLRVRLHAELHRAAQGLQRLDAHARWWADEENSLLRRQDKVAAEAVLLAFLATRVPDPEGRLGPAAGALVEAAEHHIATVRNHAILRRFPQTAATIGVGFVLLECLGRGVPEVTARLRRAATGGYLTLSERSVFRLMDARWTYRLLDPALAPPPAELTPLSTLAARPHPVHTMNEDAYALTHAVFYLTDFGSRPADANLRALTAGVLEPYLAWNTLRPDLDLLGELLAAALMLGHTDSPAFRFAWRLVFDSWDAGRLAGPEYDAARAAALQGDERDAYEFSENYHTQFVAAILCAVALTVVPRATTEQTPPADLRPLTERAGAAAERAAQVTDGGAEPGVACPADSLLEWCAARLLLLRGADVAHPPPWLQTAANPAVPRDEVVAVLHDALLTEAGRGYNLLQLAEALAVGATVPRLRTISYGRMLEFLLDQQLADGHVGMAHLLAGEAGASVRQQAQAAMAASLRQVAAGLAG